MRTTPMAPSSIRWTPSAITGIYQGRGRCSFPINQKASRKRVWSASTTVQLLAYVWAILGAQAQTRSNILKAGTGFDAQKQFLANVEDAIASPVDIPSSIASGLRLRVRALPRHERHGPPPGQCPGLQQRNRDRRI